MKRNESSGLALCHDPSVLDGVREKNRIRSSWKTRPRSEVPVQRLGRKGFGRGEVNGLQSRRQAEYQFWLADRVNYATLLLCDSVEIDPDIRSGIPVLRGTRVPLSQALAEIADGSSIVEIADDLEIDERTIRGFIEGFSVWMDRPFKLEHSSWMNARTARSCGGNANSKA